MKEVGGKLIGLRGGVERGWGGCNGVEREGGKEKKRRSERAERRGGSNRKKEEHRVGKKTMKQRIKNYDFKP